MKLSNQEILDLIEDSRLDYKKENIIGKCPKCGHKEFGISLKENHLFGCYRKNKCGFSGNIFSLLKYFGKLQDYIGDEKIYSIKQGKLVDKLRIENQEINLQLPTILPPLGFRRIFHHPKLEERGFVESDYYKFEVGTTKIDRKFKDYLIFLFRREGEIKGYLSRHILDKKEIEKINNSYKEQGLEKKILRYRNSDTEFSKILGGSEELTEETEIVILVEGLFDKRGVDSLLQLDQQKEVKCCFTFSCDCSPEQIYILQSFKKIKKIIILYDPDVIHKLKKVSLELESYFPEVLVGWNQYNKDPDEINLDELEEILSNLYSPESFSFSKVSRKVLKN